MTILAFAAPPTNPWAEEAPFCPEGHPPSRVYRWTYDPDDSLPWFCAACRRRFADPDKP